MKTSAKNFAKAVLSYVAVILPRVCSSVEVSAVLNKGYQITLTTYVFGVAVEEVTYPAKDLL